jgi:hypothetical protein
MALLKRDSYSLAEEKSFTNEVGTTVAGTSVGALAIWGWSALPFIPGGFLVWALIFMIAGVALWLK